MTDQVSITRQFLWSDSVFDLRLPTIDNEAIEDFYKIASKAHQGVSRSNIGGWQFNVTPGMNEAYDHAIQEIENCVNHIANAVFNMDIDMYNTNSWINTNKYGSKNAFHTHPGCLFSGVYYVKVPKNKDPGYINFVREGHHLMELTLSTFAAHYAERHLQNGVSARDQQWLSHQTIEPVEGMALIFPSWYGHEVYGSLSDEEDRIAIGMNFSPRSTSKNNK